MSPNEASWEGSGVTVGQIETELQRLWRASDSDWNGEGRRPDIRTSVLNLVVYARNDDCRDRAVNAIEQLSGTHPSRSILIVAGNRSAPASIDARLTLQSHGAYAEFRQVCSEQLELRVHGPAMNHVASVALPLLAPDLPVFVWWPGEAPFGHSIFAQLRDAADRFMVDSSDFAKPSQEMALLHRAVGSSTSCVFSDFNWPRLAAWRELVAQLFDEPALLPYLQRLRAVWIECAPPQSPSASMHDVPQAMLLSGWLGSSLGLQPSELKIGTDHYALQLASEGRQGTLDVQVSSTSTGQSLAVRMIADAVGDLPSAEFSIALDRKTDQITSTVKMAGADPTVRRSVLPERDEGQLLFSELETFQRDEAYEQALAAAAQTVEPRQREAVRGPSVGVRGSGISG